MQFNNNYQPYYIYECIIKSSLAINEFSEPISERYFCHKSKVKQNLLIGTRFSTDFYIFVSIMYTKTYALL